MQLEIRDKGLIIFSAEFSDQFGLNDAIDEVRMMLASLVDNVDDEEDEL